MRNVWSRMQEYRRIYREEGFKVLVVKMGKPAAILLFFFFLIKGIIWLAVFYGLFEGTKQIMD